MTVYIDSSVFLAIFNGEKRGPEILELLRELKREKTKIVTSIITVQEVSVASYRTAGIATDNHAKVHKFAKIEGVTRDVALTSAKIEASVLDRSNFGTLEEKREDNKRRKWDCFHIATAECQHCDKLYSLDPGMLNRQKLLGITKIQFMEPVASMPPLFALSENAVGTTQEEKEISPPPEPENAVVGGDGPTQDSTGSQARAENGSNAGVGAAPGRSVKLPPTEAEDATGAGPPLGSEEKTRVQK